MTVIADLMPTISRPRKWQPLGPPPDTADAGPCAPPAIEDEVSLSPAARRLNRDAAAIPSTRYASTSLDFQFEFHTQDHLSLTVQGAYSAKTTALQMSLTFRYQEAVTIDGRTELHWFEATLNVRAEQLERSSITRTTKKEDILDVIQRLVKHIREARDAKNTRLGGVVLEFEDFRDLALVDNGRTANMLVALIGLVINHTHFLKQMDEDEPITDVILHPHRKQQHQVKVESSLSAFQEINLTITDLTAQESTQKDTVQTAPGVSQILGE
jgi:hypothetical protein